MARHLVDTFVDGAALVAARGAVAAVCGRFGLSVTAHRYRPVVAVDAVVLEPQQIRQGNHILEHLTPFMDCATPCLIFLTTVKNH